MSAHKPRETNPLKRGATKRRCKKRLAQSAYRNGTAVRYFPLQVKGREFLLRPPKEEDSPVGAQRSRALLLVLISTGLTRHSAKPLFGPTHQVFQVAAQQVHGGGRPRAGEDQTFAVEGRTERRI